MTWRDQFVQLPGHETTSLQEKLMRERTQTIYVTTAGADEKPVAVYYFDAVGNLNSFNVDSGGLL